MHILSYQTLSADKNWKSYKGQTKLVKKMVAFATIGVKAHNLKTFIVTIGVQLKVGLEVR